jgi:DNA-binding CsgD family transcriptional regulator
MVSAVRRFRRRAHHEPRHRQDVWVPGWRAGLSRRQSVGTRFDIFLLIASGKSHEEIATLLSISVKTVTNQHSLIRQKLAIGSDIELFQLAVECGAVEAHVRRS